MLIIMIIIANYYTYLHFITITTKEYIGTDWSKRKSYYQRIAKVSSNEILMWILSIGCEEVDKCLPRPFDDRMKSFMEYYHQENPNPSCSVLPNGYD